MYERVILCGQAIALSLLLLIMVMLARPVQDMPQDKQVVFLAEDGQSALSLMAEDTVIAGAVAPGDEVYIKLDDAEEMVEESEPKEPEEEETPGMSEEELLAHWAAQADDPDAYQILVNCLQNVVTVYERDEAGEYTVPVRAMLCSVGENPPLGTYDTINRDEWRPLFGGAYGQYATRIVDHILFHSVPYRRASGDTLYYEAYNLLGETASAGCIRLTAADAKWIFDYCALGTTVILYESEDPGPLGKPELVPIDLESPNRNWDPTDPNPENPWRLEAEDTEQTE